MAHRESRRIGDFIQRHAWLCVYCAGFAEHKDHLVPEPWTGATARRFVPVVPACADCNYTISDATRFTIPERAAIVAERIRHKHRKQLAIPDRDDEWFDDLGERMRSNLRARQAFRQELRRRLQVLEAGGADCVVDNLWIST